MKKKIFSFVLFVSIFLIPFTNVSAAWKYRFKRMPVSDIVTNIPSNTNMLITSSGTCTSDSYGNHPGCMKLSRIGNKYTLAVHEINNGTYYYHGYCLHAGKQIYENATMETHKGFSELPDIHEKILSSTAEEVLKNIVASGYQNKEGNIGNLVTGNYSALGTCPNANTCRKVLVTQILIWEVTSGARTNYDYVPNVSNPSNSPHNALIETNSNLKAYYKSVLQAAKELASPESVPSSFGKTYTLKWSDASNKYMSDEIYIGDYKVNFVNTATFGTSSKTANNTIKVGSTLPITTPKVIPVKKVVGSSSADSLSFWWLRFKSDKNGSSIKTGTAQDVLLGDYARIFENKFYVKTESGKFKISKIDADTRKILLGSKFKLYKCSGSNCSKKEYIREIDLTSKAQAVEVTINKSGTYLFEETKVPFGYKGLGQFMVNFSISDNYAYITKIYSNSANIQKLSDGTLVKNSLIIENKSTDFTISKIDGSTNTAIKGATFQIKDSKGNLVKFDYSNGKFRYSKTGSITSLVDPNSSKYVITLLPEGSYTIVETAVPYPYNLSGTASERQTQIKISVNSLLYVKNYNNTFSRSSNATVTIKNFKTKAEIIKSGNKGQLLKGVTFEIYDSKKQKQIVLTKTSDGVYSYSQNQNTSPIQIITNSVGKITINSLPPGKYWVKEVATVGNHVIDKTVEWTQFEVVVNKNSSPKVTKTIRNAKATFNFYKIDEDGNYLSAGKFKLQKYNTKTKKYQDVSLLYNNTDNTYAIDNTGKSNLIVFTPKNGVVTFVEVEANTKYRVVEIEAPEGFIMPEGSDAQADIVINENGYAEGNSVIINQKITTKVELIKSGNKGQLLKGVTFEIYDSKKQKQIALIKTSDGVYSYSEDQGITPIKIITNDVGKITINDLPPGKFWVKEVATVGNHVIDETVEWTQFEVVVNRNSSPKVTKTIRNAKATFNFYKMDEDGNYLSAGKFKLQKYNEKKNRYEDVSLLYNKTDNTYTIDTTGKSNLTIFTPQNGIVTFVEVEAKSKYRVVEIEAPEGFILPEVSETQAEIVINENGYAQGDSVIINKKITVGEGAQASAELIINISTGQNRIQYILIIAVLVTIITGLFIINRKIRKK